MNQPRKPADLPAQPDPGETPKQDAPSPQRGKGGPAEEAEPKGRPTPDRHETETAGS